MSLEYIALNKEGAKPSARQWIPIYGELAIREDARNRRPTIYADNFRYNALAFVYHTLLTVSIGSTAAIGLAYLITDTIKNIIK